MIFSPAHIRQITPLNPCDCFPDGRPRVPDDLLKPMKLVMNDAAWGVLHRRQATDRGGALHLQPDRCLHLSDRNQRRFRSVAACAGKVAMGDTPGAGALTAPGVWTRERA